MTEIEMVSQNYDIRNTNYELLVNSDKQKSIGIQIGSQNYIFIQN